MVSFSSAFSTRRLSASIGSAAKGMASAPSTRNVRSGIRGPLQLAEEVSNVLPQFSAAGQAVPLGSNQAGQLVTLIDWHDVILMHTIQPVDQKRFHIAL